MQLSRPEIEDLGFAAVGDNVSIDHSAAFFGAQHITLGDNVRIDCFCLISAGPGAVSIGRNVHIAAGAQIFGGGGVQMEDFTCLSGRVSLYSVNDDYTEGHLTNPTVPDQYRQVTMAPVKLERHVLVGAGSVVLPGVTLGRGSAVGALSLVRHSVPEGAVVAGNPLRRLGERDVQRLAQLELEYLNNV